jgi:hypothetical protein
MCVCAYTGMYVCMYICMYVCVLSWRRYPRPVLGDVYMYGCMFVSACVYVRIHVCMYVCMCFELEEVSKARFR